VEEDVAKNKAQLEEDVAKKKAQLEEDVAYPEDKSALQFLIKSKGSPLGVVSSQNTTLGYHELKAIHINEPALYSLIFGSRKEEAREFKRWVCTAVLPCIRRKGFFGNFAVTLKARNDELQLALKARDDELQLALKDRDEAHMAQLEVSLGRRDDRILSRLAQQCEQLSVRVVFAMQRSVATALQPLLLSLQPLGELLGSLKGLTSSVSMSVRGAVKDVIDAAVTSADSKLGKAFRAATKAPAKRKTSNPSEFPESQRASPKQKVNILTLAKVAMNEFPQNELHFNTWEAVKSGFGKRAKAERMRCKTSQTS
jgi:prophage antirepressor-like protein